MNRRYLLLTSLAAAAFLPQARALSDSVYGTLTAQAVGRVEYDSNIYSNNSQKGDTVFSLIPELDFVRNQGLLSLDAAAGLSLQRFADVSSANNNSPFANAALNWKPDEAKTSGGLILSYLRNNSANPSVLARTTSDDYLADTNIGQFISEKFGYRVKAGYSLKDYVTAGLSNTSYWNLGGEARYQYSPKTEGFVSYTYRADTIGNRAGGAADIKADDHLFSTGIEGELAPKLTGRLEGGLVTRQFKKHYLANQTGLLLKGAVTWAVKEGTEVGFTLGQDYDLSPTDQSIKRFSLGVAGSHQLSPKLTLTAAPGYSHDSYVGPSARTDDAFTFRAGATYTFTPEWSANIYFSYRDTSSSLSYATYDRSNLGCSIIARF